MISEVINNDHQRNGKFQLKPLVKYVSIVLAIGSSAVLNSGYAYAEEAVPLQTEDKSKIDDKSKAEGTALPSVTVTSQKREESVQEVKTAITALSGKDLLDQGVGIRMVTEIRDLAFRRPARREDLSLPEHSWRRIFRLRTAKGPPGDGKP